MPGHCWNASFRQHIRDVVSVAGNGSRTLRAPHCLDTRVKKRRTRSPPTPTQSTTQTWLVRAVALVVAIACCGRLWLLLEAISKRRYVSVIRGRPTRIFHADSDPQRFWISIGWDAALTCTLLAVIVWFAYAGWASHRRTHL